MKCPKCGFFDSKVVDTRSVLEDSVIRRRRVCLNCGFRFVTTESVAVEFPVVIKRNGQREEFDKNKIKRSLERAFKKAEDLEETIRKLLHEITLEIFSNYSGTITSREIGDIVLKTLRRSDELAYLRFVSVYKEFDSPKDFISEFKKMSPNKNTESQVKK